MKLAPQKITSVIAALCAAFGAQAQHPTIENAREFISTGHFDGAGPVDVVIVDKATGNYRAGLGDTGFQLNWRDAETVGLSPVTTLTVGTLPARSHSTFVVAEPTANRLHEIQIGEATPFARLFPAQVGPVLALAVNARSTGAADLLIGTARNAVGPNQLGLYDPAAMSTPLSIAQLGSNRPAQAREVIALRNGLIMAGVMSRNATDSSFRLIDLRSGTLQTAVQIDALPLSTRFASGFATGGTNSLLIFWDPTDASGALNVRALSRDIADVWSASVRNTFNFSEPIQQVELLHGLAFSELLIAFASGEMKTFVFDGIAAPTPGPQVTSAADPYHSFVALDAERAVLFGSSRGESSDRFSVRHRNSPAWNVLQQGRLPPLAPSRGVINLWEYQNEPFVAANPGFIGQRAVEDWTDAVNLAALPQLFVTAERFQDTSLGLGNPTLFNAGPADAGTRHALVNQYHPSISVFALEQPGPPVAGHARPVPPPGDYAGSVELRFEIAPPNAPGVQALYRFDDQGEWLLYSQPIRLYRATTVSYYTQDSAGARGAIRQARYTFQASPGRLDADSDGVPDYVEVFRGQDPSAGADSDSDGITDLDEIVPRNTRNATTFAATIIPSVFDGTAGRFVAPQPETPVHARTPQGLTVDQAAVRPPPTNSAALVRLPRSPEGRLLSASLPANFQGATPTPTNNPFFGRELLTLRVSPPQRSTEVPYDWISGDAATAAQAWINAAISELGTPEPPVEWDLSPTTTLIAILFERKIETLLQARGLPASQSALTLFPHRPQDIGREAVMESTLLRLESPSAGTSAYLLGPLLESITAALNMTAAAPLRDLALDLYRISSRELDGSTSLPLPVDALRQFLRTGQLPPGYASATSLSAIALNQAAIAATTALTMPVARPFVERVLVIPADPLNPLDCTLLNDEQGNAWSLIDAQGRRWRLYDAFILPPGTRVNVGGFADQPSSCGAPSIQVESIALASLPGIGPTDTDGDLLDDAWEQLHFRSLAQSRTEDFDRDGFSNFQEFLEGTNPADAASRGTQVAVLGPPALELDIQPGGTLRLRFHWPESFDSRVNFEVLSTASLNSQFESVGLGPTRTPDGTLVLELPPPPTSSRFFLIRLSLR